MKSILFLLPLVFSFEILTINYKEVVIPTGSYDKYALTDYLGTVSGLDIIAKDGIIYYTKKLTIKGLGVNINEYNSDYKTIKKLYFPNISIIIHDTSANNNIKLKNISCIQLKDIMNVTCNYNHININGSIIPYPHNYSRKIHMIRRTYTCGWKYQWGRSTNHWKFKDEDVIMSYSELTSIINRHPERYIMFSDDSRIMVNVKEIERRKIRNMVKHVYFNKKPDYVKDSEIYIIFNNVNSKVKMDIYIN